jgi:hypothetical protein
MAIDWNRPVEIDGTRYWPLTWAHNDYAYVNSWNAAKDTLIGRTLHRFFRRWQDVQFRVAKYDSESLDIKDGDVFPWWSGSYWVAIPFRLANRYCTKIPAHFG